MYNFNSSLFGNEFHSNPRSAAAKGFSLIALAFLVGTVPVASAATNVVTVCDQASLQSAVASGGTIQFGCDGTIVLTNTLVISQNTVIDGNGRNVTISGNDAVRVFQVNPGITFTLANLTVANGKVDGTNAASGSYGIGGGGIGAGLYNNGGAVVLSGVTFTGNTVHGGSAISMAGGQALGAGIYQLGGSIAGTNCVFSGNKATGGTSGSSKSGVGAGGGIFNESGTIIFSGSTFGSNNAVGGSAGASSAGDGFGGGIYTTNGLTTLVNCQFSNNRAVTETNLTSSWGGGGFASGGAIFQGSGTLNLIGSDFTTNDVVACRAVRYAAYPGDGNGGAVFNNGTLNSTNCTFLGNQAQGGNEGTARDGQGGAIYNGGVANLVRATIAGNQCMGGQGSVRSVFQGAYPSGKANGGGIYNTNTFLMLESTLSGNIAVGGIGGDMDTSGIGRGERAYGGGIYNMGVFIGTNNTVVGNIAQGGAGGINAYNGVVYRIEAGGNAYGGAIFNSTNGTMKLTHLTLANNAAIGGAGDTNTMGVAVGGGIVSSNGTVSLYNSIVANNTGTNFVGSTIVDGGGNISSDASVSFSASGSHTNMNPMLGTLGYYGGPTPTVPLLPGSPAINSGLAAFCPPTDQRGVPRSFAGMCDIGAFESVPLFTISGKITGFQNGAGIKVNVGGNSGMINGDGNYVITNIPGGTCIVTPSAPGWMFTPAYRVIPLNASIGDVNFSAYRANAITLESWTGNTMGFAFPGTVGQSYEIQSSTNLLDWVAVSTNTVPASGVIQFTVTNGQAVGGKYWRAVRR